MLKSVIWFIVIGSTCQTRHLYCWYFARQSVGSIVSFNIDVMNIEYSVSSWCMCIVSLVVR